MATRKQKNNLTLYIGLAAVAIAVFLIIKNKKKKQEQASEAPEKSTNNANNSSNGTPKPSTPTCDETKILKKGMNTNSWESCNYVVWAQNKFNALHAKGTIKLPAKLTVDGIFGAKTEQAFKIAMGKTTASWKEIRIKYPMEK